MVTQPFVYKLVCWPIYILFILITYLFIIFLLLDMMTYLFTFNMVTYLFITQCDNAHLHYLIYDDLFIYI